MNIGGISRDLSTQSVQRLQQSDADSSIQPEASLDATGSAAQVQLSKPGELMQKLSQLQASDPAKFKDVVQKISDSFATAAKNATGDDAKRLQDVADKFAQAAESGDLSAFRPAQAGAHAPQGAGADLQGAQAGYAAHRGHGHHHHGGAPSKAMSDALSSAVSIVNSAT
jgi:hypothetical protein